MRIGILSLWHKNNNYGQLLQCYALQEYFRGQGHEPEHIRYSFVDRKNNVERLIKLISLFNPIKLSKFIVEKHRAKAIDRQLDEDPKRFNEFRNKYLKFTRYYNGYDDLVGDPPNEDMYVVGSDQVWNFYEYPLKDVRKRLHAVFLDFGEDKIIRKSYAASFGGMKFDDEFVREIKPLLNRFDEITVREKSGVEVCESLGRADAKWVCDPTLLLSKSEYRKLYSQSESIEEVRNFSGYILFYYLGNDNDFDIERVYEFAREVGKEVILITGNYFQTEMKTIDATVEQWLYLIDNADCVITDSYHCSIFASLFDKELYVIRLGGAKTGMNTRFDSLFEMLNVEGRFFS